MPPSDIAGSAQNVRINPRQRYHNINIATVAICKTPQRMVTVVHAMGTRDQPVLLTCNSSTCPPSALFLIHIDKARGPALLLRHWMGLRLVYLLLSVSPALWLASGASVLWWRVGTWDHHVRTQITSSEHHWLVVNRCRVLCRETDEDNQGTVECRCSLGVWDNQRKSQKPDWSF